MPFHLSNILFLTEIDKYISDSWRYSCLFLLNTKYLVYKKAQDLKIKGHAALQALKNLLSLFLDLIYDTGRTPLLKGYFFAKFSSNSSKTPGQKFLIILKTLVSWFRCVIRVGPKLCRTVALQELSSMTMDIMASHFNIHFFKLKSICFLVLY